ncbi:hypothetical protein RJ639_027950 [Escallonia herrerae]|uniref:AP2/ERF domain-containing protein n=1 Tax=Escallonia herrerae TaxID=1293975 RepID=A0AA88X3J3_9ASTE|nr:hypothetical protein RJ639_027950 [Escallonia herrerae]
MDNFSHSYFSDPFPYLSNVRPLEEPEASSIVSTTSRPCNVSDEGVLPASSKPKKRAGRKKFRETRHQVYRGVRRRNSGKWVCEVREPNKKTRIWRGTFPTAEMAARAHDVAAIVLRGMSACLDSAWRLPVPASPDAKDIQKAEAEAAEVFRPAESEEDVKEEECGVAALPEEAFYMDEEVVFGMPGLLTNLAEGLMMPPPHCVDGDGGYNYDRDELEFNADVSLWSYSGLILVMHKSSRVKTIDKVKNEMRGLFHSIV